MDDLFSVFDAPAPADLTAGKKRKKKNEEGAAAAGGASDEEERMHDVEEEAASAEEEIKGKEKGSKKKKSKKEKESGGKKGDDKKKKKKKSKNDDEDVENEEGAGGASAAAAAAAEGAGGVSITADGVKEESAFPEVKIEQLASDSSLHEVALPPNFSLEDVSTPLPPDHVFAREYKFKLDTFQQRAVEAIERNQNVLVAAHTSAGKTAVAEYAIAKSIKNQQRVIYTTPLKALSNQKFRDFQEEFADVGLMTGDVTINQNASCLVMTTEILRSMLYRGSEVVREVAWIVFDEIHYMRDRDRGVVWEESIVLVPDAVRFVFLSATIPNASEFAAWVAAVHMQPCHVVYTDYRPTPLQHYVFPAGGEGLYLVVDEKGQFREEQFHKACTALENAPAKSNDGGGGKKRRGGGGGAAMATGGKGGGDADIYKIVKVIMERNYDPVIVFAFSKKDCETLAMQMSKLDFNTEVEKASIRKIFHSALDCLNDDDRHLPQVEHMLPLLERGIGIHHGGLLPILKEVIEILFQESLVKCLMATETFSMGLNMPAKTVVFTSVRKWDGEKFRYVLGGEYIQMSGRAGRRGLDDRGIVILMMDEKMEPNAAKGMLKGHSDPLNSTFHLGYNMILNLMRFDGADPVSLIKRSFYQFQTERSKPDLEKKLSDLTSAAALISVQHEKQASEFFRLNEVLTKLRGEVKKVISSPIYALPFLNPGRLVEIRVGRVYWGWGVLVNFQKHGSNNNNNNNNNNNETDVSPSARYSIDVLLPAISAAGGYRPVKEGEVGEMQVLTHDLANLQSLSSIRIHIPTDLRAKEPRETVSKSLREIKRRFETLPLLHLVNDIGVKDPSIVQLVQKIEEIEEKVESHPMKKAADEMAEFERREEMFNEIKVLKKQIKTTAAMAFQSELKHRKHVLRRLAYTNAEDVVSLKGRLACQINTADELLLSELLLGGVFNELTPMQCAGLLSCFVFDEKVKETTRRIRKELESPFRSLQDAARRIATVANDCRIQTDVDGYVDKFNPAMMDVVYSWTEGSKFSEVMKLAPGSFEGSVIRVIRRLDETLLELIAACKVIGNEELAAKFEKTEEMIKRDIVFAASLYLC